MPCAQALAPFKYTSAVVVVPSGRFHVLSIGHAALKNVACRRERHAPWTHPIQRPLGWSIAYFRMHRRALRRRSHTVPRGITDEWPRDGSRTITNGHKPVLTLRRVLLFELFHTYCARPAQFNYNNGDLTYSRRCARDNAKPAHTPRSPDRKA